MGPVAVDPHRRTRRGTPTATTDAGSASTSGRRSRRSRSAATPSGNTSARGSHRDHAARRHDPLVGVERSQHFVRVPPRVELHRADRQAARFEIVDRGDNGRRRVETGLGPVPVRAAVVGPVRNAGAERRRHRAPGAATPDAERSSRAQRSKQSRAPSPAITASSVAKPASTSSMSPCHPASRPASACSRSAGTDDHLLVKRLQRREQQRAPVGRDQSERKHDRRAGSAATATATSPRR